METPDTPTITATAATSLNSKIYRDVLHLLYGYLDFRTLLAFGRTCKVAWTSLLALERLKFGSVRLSPLQDAIRTRICGMPTGVAPLPTPDAGGLAIIPEPIPNVFVVRAPMGFGKTILGYSVAFLHKDDPHRYAIIVPPKAYDTWVREAEKIFGKLTAAVTADTPVLFAHSNVPAHKKYVDKAVEALNTTPVKINTVARLLVASKSPPKLKFGCRARVVVVSSASQDGIKVARKWADRVIVDEAHTMSEGTIHQLKTFNWRLMLSANQIPPEKLPGAPWGTSIVSAGYMTGTIPTVKLRRIEIKPYAVDEFNEAKSFTTAGYKIESIAKNLDEYRRALMEIFADIQWGNVAVYLPDGDTGDAIVAELPVVAPGWACIPFDRATSKIREFESLSRSILVIRLNKSESINILATHLVIVRPDWVNPTRYSQLVGRVLRPTNTNKETGVFLIVPRGVPAKRAYYYEALRRLMAADLIVGMVEYRALEFERAEGCLRACGSSLERALPEEILAALGIGFDDPNAGKLLYASWKKAANQTLSGAQMAALLGVAEAEPAAPLSSKELEDILDFM